MPWVPWMDGIFQSYLQKGEAASTTTTRASHSIVLLALLDRDYKFLWVEVGGCRVKLSNLRHKIEDSSIGLPASESLGIGGPKVNFFILRDDASPLKALANEALLKTRYGLEGESLQLQDQPGKKGA